MRNSIRKRLLLGLAAAVIAIVLILAGLRFVAYPSFVSAPDHMHLVVTRIDPPSTGRAIIFDQQFDGVARQVYAQLVAGTRIPPNTPLSCPPIGLAPYYHYDLMFSRLNIQTGVASSDVRGCQIIELDPTFGSREYYLSSAPNGTSFWATLHELLNAPLPI